MEIKKSKYKKYFSNFSWLLVIKVYRILITLFITIWMARYLGPEQFGLYNYALSLVVIFAVFSSLGLEHIFTKELLNKPNEESELFGSSFILKLLGSIILLILVIITILVFKPNNDTLLYMVTLFSISYLFRTLEIIRFWFEAHIQAKNSTVIEAIAISFSTLLKVLMIINEVVVEIFAWTVLSEAIFLVIGLVLIYKQAKQNIYLWKPSLGKMKYLLKEAWPLILAGALYTVYTKVDQIMLGEIVGNESVGLYVAAVNISQGWLFIPIIIGTAFYPVMINSKKNDEEKYYQITQHLLNILALLGIVIATITIFLSEPFILFAFGESYIKSSNVLILHIWGGVFVAMSAISYRYFITEGLQKTSFYRGLVGLVVNIGLNFVLIPRYGAIGAAYATVISLAASLYIFNITNHKTRRMFFMQTRALFLIDIIKTLKYLKILRDSR